MRTVDESRPRRLSATVLAGKFALSTSLVVPGASKDPPGIGCPRERRRVRRRGRGSTERRWQPVPALGRACRGRGTQLGSRTPLKNLQAAHLHRRTASGQPLVHGEYRVGNEPSIHVSLKATRRYLSVSMLPCLPPPWSAVAKRSSRSARPRPVLAREGTLCRCRRASPVKHLPTRRLGSGEGGACRRDFGSVPGSMAESSVAGEAGVSRAGD